MDCGCKWLYASSCGPVTEEAMSWRQMISSVFIRLSLGCLRSFRRHSLLDMLAMRVKRSMWSAAGTSAGFCHLHVGEPLLEVFRRRGVLTLLVAGDKHAVFADWVGSLEIFANDVEVCAGPDFLSLWA